MKKSLMALTLLLTSVSQMALANETQKSFPQNLYGGYWAMANPIFDEYAVINFYQKDGVEYSDSYRFSCENGKYQQLNKETAQLIADGDGFLMQDKDGSIYSKLTQMFFKPKEGLILKQTMTDEMLELKEILPDGILLVYFYTETLKPEC